MAERSIPPPPPQPAWQVLAAAGAFAILNTAFPRLGRMLFWTARLSRRGVVAYVAFRVILQWGMVEGMLRWAARAERVREEARTALAAQLGREPTDEEIDHALMREVEEP